MADADIIIGQRVRFKRPGGAVWRYGNVKRWTVSRKGRRLVQVTVDRIGDYELRPASTAKILAENLESVSNG